MCRLDPVPAWIDAERLKQVLDNLLSNAIKYTPQGGQITFRLRVEEGQAALSVSDTGRGIPPQHLTKLFTKYHRVPGDATRGILGTGLGLLIVKEIVEAHGGTVQVVSEGMRRERDQRSPSGFHFNRQAQPIKPPPSDQLPSLEPIVEEDIVTEELTQDPEFRKLFWEETQKQLSVLREALTGSRLVVW